MLERPPIFDRMTSLADATRARLLLLLERRELTVSEACSVLQLPQSTVSRHLKVLADDGWVDSRRDGTRRLYRMRGDGLAPSAEDLWQLTRDQVAATPAAGDDVRRLESVLAARRQRSREFFRSAAGEWDRLRRELFGDASESAALLGLLDPEWVVGDLGCGTGRAAAALAPFVAQVIAVDASDEMLEAARRRLEPAIGANGGHRPSEAADGAGEASAGRVELRRGELEALPVAGGELDVALLLLVLHHVVDPPDALAEAARCLKPGGRLLILDMHRHERQEYREQMGHLWLGFERRQLADWLAAAGFEAIRQTTLPPDPDARGPALFAVAARRRAAPPADPAPATGR